MLLSANLIPGVTEIKPSSLIIGASNGEHTTPCKPALAAFSAYNLTTSSSGLIIANSFSKMS